MNADSPSLPPRPLHFGPQATQPSNNGRLESTGRGASANGLTPVPSKGPPSLAQASPWDSSASSAATKLSLFTHTNGDSYKGELKDGVRHGSDGEYRWKSGPLYRGQFSHGSPHGRGKITFPDGAEFDGFWSEGEYSYGEFKTAGGDSYTGPFRKNQFEGSGKMTYASGEVYEGQWEGDEWHGDGSLTYPNGSKLTGRFQHGVVHGKGKYATAEGTFDGDFEEGLMHFGKYYFVDGSVFIGEFKDNQIEGKGQLLMPNKDFFEGTFVAGAMHGPKCKYSYANGCAFEGDFASGLKTKGTFSFPDGSLFEGSFDKVGLPSEGKLFFPSGDSYQGAFKNGLYEDQNGVYLTKAGAKYSGGFVAGKRSGQGELIISDETFSGTFEDDLPTHGRIRFDNGDVFEGPFENGRPHGSGTYVFSDGSKLVTSFIDGKPESGEVAPKSEEKTPAKAPPSLPAISEPTPPPQDPNSAE